jgi:hypothetical protein
VRVGKKEEGRVNVPHITLLEGKQATVSSYYVSKFDSVLTLMRTAITKKNAI